MLCSVSFVLCTGHGTLGIFFFFFFSYVFRRFISIRNFFFFSAIRSYLYRKELRTTGFFKQCLSDGNRVVSFYLFGIIMYSAITMKSGPLGYLN